MDFLTFSNLIYTTVISFLVQGLVYGLVTGLLLGLVSIPVRYIFPLCHCDICMSK